MGIYIPFFYIQLYAVERASTSQDLATWMLVLTNAGSVFGRIGPNYISDCYIGPLNTHIPFAVATTVLGYTWIVVRSPVAVIIFAVLYGFFSGTFVSLGAPICFGLTTDPQTIGTRLGVVAGVSGIGLLIGNPIAGAILDGHGWPALQVWSGTLLALSTALIVATRTIKYGTSLNIKV